MTYRLEYIKSFKKYAILATYFYKQWTKINID